MAKKVSKENFIVKSKVYTLVKESGLRIGGDYLAALSDKVDGYIKASVQKVQADGKKKTLTAEDLA